MPTMKSFLSRAMFLVPAFAAALTAASCSSSSPPPPSVFIQSTLGINPAAEVMTESCTNKAPGEPFFTIGTMNGADPSPVSDGTVVDGNPIQIDCEVSSNGMGGYNVNLSVNEGEVGAISLFGTLTDTMSPQSGIQASFTTTVGTAAISYSTPSMPVTSECTVTLSPQGNPAITAGRVWGTLNCPDLVDVQAAGATCLGTATFLFQECSE